MDVGGTVGALVRGIATARKLVDTFAANMKAEDARTRLRKRLAADRMFYVEGMRAHISPFFMDYLEAEEMTYARVCENIFKMIFIRQDIVMSLEKLLRKKNVSDRAILSAIYDVHHSLVTLKDLILGFYVLVSVMGNEKFAIVPSEINKMFAETTFAIKEMQEMFSQERSPDELIKTINYGDNRKQLEIFCKEMKGTVTYLCEMKLRPGKEQKARSGSNSP